MHDGETSLLHPVVKGGPIEIRAAADHTEMNRERERRALKIQQTV
jgi:hypothetical protein